MLNYDGKNVETRQKKRENSSESKKGEKVELRRKAKQIKHRQKAI